VERFLSNYLHRKVVHRVAVFAELVLEVERFLSDYLHREVVLGVEGFLPDYLHQPQEVVRRIAALVEQGHPKLEDQH
jgi:hypothetical protein